MAEPSLLALAEHVARSLVTEPEHVQVEEVLDGSSLTIKVRVASQDVGRLIGRRGRTIGALRTLVEVGASASGLESTVEVVEP